MRKFFLMAVILVSATAAHAGADLTVAGADVQPTTAPSSAAVQATAQSAAELPDAGDVAAKRQAMIQQKMATQKQIAMQRQMAMQREMQRHPIRTRLHFALLRFKQKLRAF